jgi:hypothetical protein
VQSRLFFFIKVSKSSTHKLGKSVSLNLLINQHKIDSDLLKSFTQILGCGTYSTFALLAKAKVKKDSEVGTFLVTGFNNLPLIFLTKKRGY